MSSNKKPVIICATKEGRAVLFGWVDGDPVPNQPVTIYDARMVLYWGGKGGLFGLAAKGPSPDSRITQAVPRVVEHVWAQCLDVTDKAAKALAEHPPC